MGVSKVVLGDKTLIDLTSDTVTSSDLKEGVTAHGANGEVITGVNNYDVNSSDATASASEILLSKIACVKGNKITGTMPDNGAANITISNLNDVSIPEGYYDGTGKVAISETEKAKIISGNIKSGVTILGVRGASTMQNTSDATASASEILSGKTAYVNGNKITGIMQNRETITHDLTYADEEYTIPQGYHSGNGKVKIDSSEKTKIVSENIRADVNILGVDGTFTADGTANTSEILYGEIAYVNGEKITGTMPNNSANNGTIAAVNDEYSIPAGYHNGNGKVSIDSTEKAKIIAENIKSGVSILGIDGTFTSDATVDASEVLSSKTAYVNGEKITGTMPDNGAANITISNLSDVSIPEGYYDGTGKVAISETEKAKIVSGNIKSGVSILGVEGSFSLSGAALTPYVYDLNRGYVNNGVWYYESPTRNYVDLYQVFAGHRYFITLGATVGTRFRAMFTDVDLSVETSDITGETVINKDSPSSQETLEYTATADGYLAILKTNNNKAGYKTYVYDATADWL